MSEDTNLAHVFADRRVRALVGLSGGLAMAVVAVVAVEDPTVQWILLGGAALDAVITPYILGMVVEQDQTENSTGWTDD